MPSRRAKMVLDSIWQIWHISEMPQVRDTVEAACLEAGMAQHELGELGVHGGDEGLQHVVAVQWCQVQQHLHRRRVQHAAQAANPRRH